jgi:hyperosmotically inducible periplasmic protein
MKSKIKRVLLGLVLVTAVTITGCGPKDVDIEKNSTAAISAYPGVSVSVKDGVATLTGEVSNESTKASIENSVKSVKGVKSVSNNLTVMPPATSAPVEINPDATLQQSVSTIISSMNLTKVQATVKDGVVTLNGEIKKADLPTLMQKLNEIKPKKIENKLVKK